MTIVVLDGYTLNPGDLDWGPLQSLGDVTLYNRSRPEEVLHRCRGAEVVLTNKAVLSREVIAQLPDLRYIGVLATGYNVVDVDAARERGIVVANVPAYSTLSVAQHVFALILEHTHRVRLHADLVQYGAWSLNPDFSFSRGELIELADKTLGIVGYGTIGQAVARIGRAFGMHVLVHTKRPGEHDMRGVKPADLNVLFSTSDVVTLHCALTDETKHLVNNHRLYQMKRTALLVNTSRGGVVDETALANALNNGRIAGAALDVLSVEPPPKDHPLLTAPNCVITPHHAWATRAARRRLMTAVTDNVRAFLDGRPVNVVS